MPRDRREFASKDYPYPAIFIERGALFIQEEENIPLQRALLSGFDKAIGSYASCEKVRFTAVDLI